MVNIENLRRKPDYWLQEGPDWVRKIWTTQESFSWFIKANRQALHNNGAICRIGRDYFVNAEVFPETAKRILEGNMTRTAATAGRVKA